MEKKEFLEVAKVINTHGIKGELKLDVRCDSVDVLKQIPYFQIDGILHKAESVRPINGGFALLQLSDITTIDEAQKCRNKLVYANRKDIVKKEGSHFIADLIGLDVIDANTGKKYGTLEDIQQYTVQEILYIKTENGTVLMPKVPEYVKEINEEKGIMITPIPGFFDGDSADAD